MDNPLLIDAVIAVMMEVFYEVSKIFCIFISQALCSVRLIHMHWMWNFLSLSFLLLLSPCGLH